jgi:hypothetical protein
MMEITAAQIEVIYTILISKSWTDNRTFEAYQDAWQVVSAILGVTAPVDYDTMKPVPVQQVSPAVICPCKGMNPTCSDCRGKGFINSTMGEIK